MKIRPKKTGKGVEVEASSELDARYQLGKVTRKNATLRQAGAAYLSAPIKLVRRARRQKGLDDDVRFFSSELGPPFQATSS
jgi:hypothetical protein